MIKTSLPLLVPDATMDAARKVEVSWQSSQPRELRQKLTPKNTTMAPRIKNTLKLARSQLPGLATVALISRLTLLVRLTEPPTVITSQVATLLTPTRIAEIELLTIQDLRVSLTMITWIRSLKALTFGVTTLTPLTLSWEVIQALRSLTEFMKSLRQRLVSWSLGPLVTQLTTQWRMLLTSDTSELTTELRGDLNLN